MMRKETVQLKMSVYLFGVHRICDKNNLIMFYVSNSWGFIMKKITYKKERMCTEIYKTVSDNWKAV